MSPEILLALIVGLICLVVILFRPYFGLLLFTLLIYIRPGDFLPALGLFHITRIVAGFTFLVLIFQRQRFQRPILRDSRQIRLLTALFVLMCFAVLTSIWKANSLKHIFGFIKIYIGFLLIINLADSVKKIKGVVLTMVFSGLVLGVWSVINYFQSASLLSEARIKAMVSGMFSDPNDLALCFIMLIPFATYLFVKNRNVFIKLLSLSSVGIFMLGTIFTKSRGGALGLLGVVLFLFLRSRNKLKAAVGLLLIAVFFFSFAPAGYIERIQTIHLGPQEDPSVISRMDAWKAGVSMISHNLLGVGPGNFGEGFVYYRPPDAIDFPGMRRAAHNAFIQIGAETGIIGLIVFLALIIVTLRDLNRTKKIALQFRNKEGRDTAGLADATFVSLVSFLICSFFLSQAYNWVLYYLVGFSVLLNEVIRQKSKVNYAKAL